MNLPAWANSGMARALLHRIQSEAPAFRLTNGAWIEGGQQPRYEGEAASQLRAIREDHLERQYAEADARFEAGEPWEVCGVSKADNETVDALIERLLATEALLDMTVQSLGGETYRVAA